MLEKYIEQKFVMGVKALGGRAYKFVSPGNSGMPDRLCVLPVNRIIFVELKQPSGRLSKLQKIQQDKLKSLGCDVRNLWSAEDVENFLREAGNGHAV